MARTKKKLGEILLGWGIVDEKAIAQALEYGMQNGKRIGEALVELELCEEEPVIKALASQLGLEFIDLDKFVIPKESFQLIPPKIVRKHLVLPIGEDYALNVSKPGYLFHSENFALAEAGRLAKPFLLEIELIPISEPTADAPTPKPVILKNVFFETGSAALLPKSTSELIRLKDLLEENPNLTIRINGHTDNVGSEEDNQLLSENRAKAVYDFLVEKGIDKERLRYKGYGESKPIASNDTPASRQENRRTEFEVVRGGQR